MHKFIMMNMVIFHGLVIAFMMSIISHSIFTKSPANLCWIFTEGSLAFYFFYNVTLMIVYHKNYKLAYEKDVDLMEKTRKTLMVIMTVSPCIYLGMFTPNFVCSAVEGDRLKSLITYQVLHILLES